MLTMAQITDRLRECGPDFHAIDGAADLAALMASAPQITTKPRAHIIPTGLRGGAVETMAGAFVQDVELAFMVVITVAAVADRKGERASADIIALQDQVISALCGWGPDEAVGVVQLQRAAPIEIKPGVIIYAIEFTIADQLRIDQ